jgi:hypothetical protein
VSDRPSKRSGLSHHSLSLVVFGLFFLTFLGGQLLTGHRVHDADEEEHGGHATTLAQYVRTSHFGEATFENWESEFLQMGAYILLTVRLRQKGSSESKPVDEDDPVDEDPELHRFDPDAPWPVRRGGISLALYKRSLSIAFFSLFAASWFLHAVTGARLYSSEELQHGGQPVSTFGYMRSAQFWFESLQNWQSEFLAVAAIVVLTIYLRQKGSPESKPVHAPMAQTGS